MERNDTRLADTFKGKTPIENIYAKTGQRDTKVGDQHEKSVHIHVGVAS